VDRDDAQLIAGALTGRISGDRELLDRLASEQFVRMARSAARVRSLAAGWPPALIAALELESIAKHGAKVADEDPAAPQSLQIFVDKMRELLEELPSPAAAILAHDG
jgi:hypothetical protein